MYLDILGKTYVVKQIHNQVWESGPNTWEPIHKDSQRLSKRFAKICESYWIGSQKLGSGGSLKLFYKVSLVHGVVLL